MKLKFKLFNKSALYIAIERGHNDVVKHLLSHPKIDVNAESILNFFYILIMF